MHRKRLGNKKEFYQPCACLAGPIAFVCLSVCSCKGWGGLGICQWRTVVTWFVRVSWLVCHLTAKGRQAMPVLPTDGRGTVLVTKPQYRNSKRNTGFHRNRQPITVNQPRSEIALLLQYSVSHKWAPWSSRIAAPATMHQSSTTCMVVRTYLVPACSSPAGF